MTATASAPRRLRMKASDCRPSTTQSASRSAVSASALRRTGSRPSGGVWRSGGSQNATVMPGRGDASSLIARAGEPIRRDVASAALAIVAEAVKTTGWDP